MIIVLYSIFSASQLSFSDCVLFLIITASLLGSRDRITVQWDDRCSTVKAAAACGVFRLRNSSVIADDKMAENEPHIVFRDNS